MSYTPGEKCGIEWTDLHGKDHTCRFDISTPRGFLVQHVCECECGAQRVREQMVSRPNKRPPLKLAKWKRGKKVTA